MRDGVYLFGDDAEAAVGHAMLDERPGRVARRVPAAHDHVPAGGRYMNRR